MPGDAVDFVGQFAEQGRDLAVHLRRVCLGLFLQIFLLFIGKMRPAAEPLGTDDHTLRSGGDFK